MPQKWSVETRDQKRRELVELYQVQNLTISEVAQKLGVGWSTVYKRLSTLNIAVRPDLKKTYLNKSPVHFPRKCKKLAEFFGIIFGDGHISRSQFFVTLNFRDEKSYVEYVCQLVESLFKIPAKITQRGEKRNVVASDIFLTSVDMMTYLARIGLTSRNKVENPPIVPAWIMDKSCYRRMFIRGIFDTDGSIYRLKSGQPQLSFTNVSTLVRQQIREILILEGFYPSQIGKYRVYLTRKSDLQRYFCLVGSSNQKHILRYRRFKAGLV